MIVSAFSEFLIELRNCILFDVGVVGVGNSFKYVVVDGCEARV